MSHFGHLDHFSHFGHSGHSGHLGHSGHSGHLGHLDLSFNITTGRLTDNIRTSRSASQTINEEHYHFSKISK